MDDYPAGDDIPDPIDYQHDELMGFLADNHDMRETARNSLKQGVWAGGGAVSGGLLLGPVGGLVGGILGSIVGRRRGATAPPTLTASQDSTGSVGPDGVD
jgi:hypothetical protein